MPDDLDRAAELTERERQAAIQERKPEGPRATGFCHYCEEPTTGRWCSVECRDDWEQEMER